MIRPDVWNDFANLPAEAQKQVTDLIADLRRKSCKSPSTVDEDVDMQAWRDDADCFESVRSTLWNNKTYRQKYVAIRQQEIIDVDEDKFELVQRVNRQYPDDVVFIAKVERQTQVVEVASPEIGP